MRLSKLVLVFAICSSSVFGQSEDTCQESAMINIVEPEFKGMNEKAGIQEFFEENLRTPSNFQSLGSEETVVIRFNVLPTRDLSEFQVIKSVSYGIDKAVINVLKASNGMWKPGTVNGRPAHMEKEVTVSYRNEGIEMYVIGQENINKADELLKEGKFSRAIRLYSRVIESFPYHDYTIYRRGLAKYYSGDLEGAKHDFERVANMDSHLADPMLAKLSNAEDFVESELQLSGLIY